MYKDARSLTLGQKSARRSSKPIKHWLGSVFENDKAAVGKEGFPGPGVFISTDKGQKIRRTLLTLQAVGQIGEGNRPEIKRNKDFFFSYSFRI